MLLLFLLLFKSLVMAVMHCFFNVFSPLKITFSFSRFLLFSTTWFLCAFVLLASVRSSQSDAFNPACLILSVSLSLSRLLKNAFSELVAFQRALKDLVSSIDATFTKQFEEFHVGFEGSFGNKHVTPRSLSARFLGNLVCVEGIVTKCKGLCFLVIYFFSDIFEKSSLASVFEMGTGSFL